MIFIAAFSQANANLSKLNKKTCKRLTSYYDNMVLHQENWKSLILNVFAEKNANMDKIYKICKDLKGVFESIKPLVEKF